MTVWLIWSTTSAIVVVDCVLKVTPLMLKEPADTAVVEAAYVAVPVVVA